MHVLSLQAASHKRSSCETQVRYDLLLNGKVIKDIYFNMRGYVGTLPLPNGHWLDIGEKGISAFKREIGKINREARENPLKLEILLDLPIPETGRYLTLNECEQIKKKSHLRPMPGDDKWRLVYCVTAVETMTHLLNIEDMDRIFTTVIPEYLESPEPQPIVPFIPISLLSKLDSSEVEEWDW